MPRVKHWSLCRRVTSWRMARENSRVFPAPGIRGRERLPFHLVQAWLPGQWIGRGTVAPPTRTRRRRGLDVSGCSCPPRSAAAAALVLFGPPRGRFCGRPQTWADTAHCQVNWRLFGWPRGPDGDKAPAAVRRPGWQWIVQIAVLTLAKAIAGHFDGIAEALILAVEAGQFIAFFGTEQRCGRGVTSAGYPRRYLLLVQAGQALCY